MILMMQPPWGAEPIKTSVKKLALVMRHGPRYRVKKDPPATCQLVKFPSQVSPAFAGVASVVVTVVVAPDAQALVTVVVTCR
jgi:hypothetical protein